MLYNVVKFIGSENFRCLLNLGENIVEISLTEALIYSG